MSEHNQDPSGSPPLLSLFAFEGRSLRLSICQGAATEGKVRFYREVELKHGRVAMLAALGFPLAETFHPLVSALAPNACKPAAQSRSPPPPSLQFGGSIDVPSYIAFQQTPLQSFWPAVVLAIG